MLFLIVKIFSKAHPVFDASLFFRVCVVSCECGSRFFLMTINQPFHHQYDDGETRFASLIPVFCQQDNRRINDRMPLFICNTHKMDINILPFNCYPDYHSIIQLTLFSNFFIINLYYSLNVRKINSRSYTLLTFTDIKILCPHK